MRGLHAGERGGARALEPPRGRAAAVSRTSRLAAAEAFQASDRGFHTVFWRSGELCYALVSDVDPKELDALAARFASSP